MEKRNLILATVLSTVVIVIWWLFTVKTQKPAELVQQLPRQETSTRGIEKIESKISKPEKARVQESCPIDTVLETGSFKAVFNTAGAQIKNFYVKEKKGDFVDLVLESNDGSYKPDNFTTFPDINFNIQSKKDDSVIFSGVIDRVEITKTFSFANNYYHKLNFHLSNQSRQPKEVNINIPWGPGIGTDAANRKSENPLTQVEGLVQIGKNLKAVKIKPSEQAAGQYRWVSMSNRYFLLALINDGRIDKVTVKQDKYGNEKLYRLVSTIKIALKPGETTSFDLPFYLGPKDYDNLKRIGAGLEHSVDFGFFKPIAKASFDLLRFFYRITGNYGVAVILLTIVVQIILLPLTIKSFKASLGMKMLQPKMKELQLKYKSDPARMNTEVMHMYKSHKINPLGGCLPMVLQIPIFFALFKTLQNAYELRYAPFILWIKDLSSPDLLFSISGMPVRILPLLMGIGMFFQQKFSGAAADPSQKSLMYIMPVMFTVIFWNFSSGLVLYWLLSSLFSMGVQYAFTVTKKTNETSVERK